MESVVYILVKNGEYRCLSDGARSVGAVRDLKSEDWTHTATINAAVWLECYLNGDELARSRQIVDVSK